MSKARPTDERGRFTKPTGTAKVDCKLCAGTGVMLAISFGTGRMGRYQCECLKRSK